MVSQYPRGGSVGRYRRLVEPAVRGRTGIAATAVVLLVGSAIGGRPGSTIAAVWVLVSGTYCFANFWCCRETHCLITGTGWSGLALLGLAGVSTPRGVLGWLGVDVLVAGFLGILCVGYGVEAVVVARTGRHVLGVGGDGAETR